MALTRRLFAAAALTFLLVTAASAESLRVTFILVNDIYLMGDQVMPDGKRRGGFARLAAVAKAERAKARTTGGHVILAHGGDTLSPSLMSGIDKGAHIIALTNMVRPDIFAPGNHEFDFGKSVLNSTSRGHLYPVRCSRQWASTASAVSVESFAK